MTSAIAINQTPKTWNWRGHNITYQQAGETGAAILLVHGFGASWGHWRKNLPVLGESYRCYAIDLIGFGGSDKPHPGTEIEYTFATWGQQLADFCREVVGSPAFLIGNSIGCIVVMQTAVDNPELALGVAAINCSIRLLHDRKRVTLPWYRNYGSMVMQRVLGNKSIGNFFFNLIAKPKVVRNILLQAYRRPEAVTDELIDILMKPSQDRGAADVFLAFTRYSQGPLPEELLPRLTCPTILLWGTEDPWEPVEMGKELAQIPTVDEFIPLEGLGHCPQDEAPEVVNPVLVKWIEQQLTNNNLG
ncbi:alpha/beta fold hydrolase [Waterburya agarophytonicola K14]|uniref:Alpha/beta fold hydrolase n=1 Tax=Waterburya agarophytonicola KI4 TaxID=2874699 RepID=A0A964FL05_9CYAN|nr:alpha/beta fold hydrolase [Waterburya agarophytonicola]MCC0179519.1 alpha/beta fold hydrolase [Waterburya agarophytonicola KI4]